ncbi:nucleotidyltransferase family protein [Gloeobacter violaceus]|uniref:Glr1164 protein n=1 Tax=Gloeobacter violaceus (strain ATCC 29082 / PCC 7421) TaxID=251221 RepID=Q7NLG0_GLOVI|nr:nucleotidyltransferase family protein [Gloeobacter violaceus]BAC89105.1 glr1164 [Gloeobacter violaceus PCC 7421]
MNGELRSISTEDTSLIPRRQGVLECLRCHWPEIQSYGVKTIAVFGSTARDEARPDSDVDLLVEFEADARVTFYQFCDLQDYLESILRIRVDLGTFDSLRPRTAAKILKEAVYV